MLNSRMMAPFTAAVVAVALAGCGDETVVQEAEEEGGVAEAMILGEPVTLQTEVQEVVGPNSFTVGQDDTLILGAGMASALEEDDQVQVTGTVRQFIETDIETDLGIDFDDDESQFFVEYEEELAVVATDVEQLPDDGLLE